MKCARKSVRSTLQGSKDVEGFLKKQWQWLTLLGVSVFQIPLQRQLPKQYETIHESSQDPHRAEVLKCCTSVRVQLERFKKSDLAENRVEK